MLESPLLSVQFLPNYTVSENKNKIAIQLVFGTNTSGREQDYVKLAQMELPSTLAPDFSSFAVGDSIPIPLNGDGLDSFKVLQSWKHPEEVNKIKVSLTGDKWVTFDNKGIVHLFNARDEAPVDFLYHQSEGYALEWVSESEFLSGANDSRIALWDIKEASKPQKEFNSHTAVINDISFSKASKCLFASVADDFNTHIHDIRAPEESPVIKITTTHSQNATAFHPLLPSLFTTGGKDNVVNLYDARNTKKPIRKFFGHNNSVVGLEWDAYDPDLLYSWGLDKRVITWDLSRLSEEVTYPSPDGAEPKRRGRATDDPCLTFIHGGHTNRINDLSVHPKIANLFATVGDDNLLEVYKSKTLLDEDEEEEDEDKDEEKDEERDEKDEKDEKDDADDESAQTEDVDMKE